MSTVSLNEKLVNGDYNKLKLNFLHWVATWVKHDNSLEEACLDIPDVVPLLQAVGYTIRHVEVLENTLPLRENEHGSRIVMSCSTSGQKFVLEQPNKNCKCTKPEIMNSGHDAFWEVTASTPNKREGYRESGSFLLPTVTKEQNSLVKHVVNHLLKILGDKNVNGSDIISSRIKGRCSEPSINPLVETPTKKTRRASVEVSQLDVNFSPARYRSLDTLISKESDIELPQPGNLIPKITIQNVEPHTQSSPNIKLAANGEHSDESTIGDDSMPLKSVALIKSASKNLLKAIAIIESGSKSTSRSSPASNIETKLVSASKSFKKLLSSSKPPSTTLRASAPNIATTRGSAGSIPKLSKLKPKTSGSYSLSRAEKKPLVKLAKPSIPVPDGVFKRTDRYAHIKSTIPKTEKK